METEWLRDLLEDVQQGEVSVNDALARLRAFPYENLEFACLDSHRTLRKGFPEVVFYPGKTTERVVQILVREMGADVVIAVDVSADAGLPPYDLPEGNGRLALPKVLQAVTPLRRVVSIMSHQIAHHRLAQAQPEVVICPRLEASMTLLGGFPHVEQIMAAGEAAAEAALSAGQCRQPSDRAEIPSP